MHEIGPGKSHRTIRMVQAGLILLFAIPALYWLLLSLNIPLPYVKFSTLHELILLAGELLILGSLYRRYASGGWLAGKYACFIRDFLIINCIFLFPFIKFYTNPLRTEIPIIQTARPYLIAAYLGLLALTGLVLWAMGDLRRASAWIISQIDGQRSKDAQSEELRRQQFEEKHPSLARIPLLGAAAKWIYLEGTPYVLVVLLLGLAGLFLRLWKLGDLPPYIDEFNHLNAARDLLQGLPVNQLEYRRSLHTVTIPVLISFKLLGLNLWAARIPGVLANLLALIPLYVLAKRINKPAALLAVGLFSFSPWVIAASRNVREYAYYPLIFYGVGLVMLKFYEALPSTVIVFQRDYRLLLKWQNLVYLAVLAFVLFYVGFIDTLSTLKMILVLYPVFGLLVMRKIDWRRPSNLATGGSILGIGIILLAIIAISTGGRFFLADYGHRNYFYFPTLFFEKPAQQWYFNRPLISLVIFALALLATPLWDRRKFVLPFSLLTFLGGLCAISFLFLKGERPRYGVNIEIFYLILVAAGLFAALMLAERWVGHKYRWAAWVILLALFWNVPQTLRAGMDTTPGWNPVTNEYHAEMHAGLSYIKSNASKDDVIITTDYVNLFTRFYTADSLDDFRVIRTDPGESDIAQKILDLIDANPSGWIVYDYPRGYDWFRPVEMHDFEYHGRQVKYLGWFGDVYILRW